ncbi:hypothetical protein JCM6882_004021 [Rhodosporidiobolus microsporus]
MKLLPLLVSLALAGSASLATAIPRDIDGSLFDKRAPEPAPAPVPAPEAVKVGGGSNALEARGKDDDRHDDRHDDRDDDVDVKIKINIRVRSGRPSFWYRPDGSGRGYGVDWRGRGRPDYVPDDWHYFGRQIGWAPYRGWRPRSPRWEPPDVFIKIWIEVKWWSPPDYWKRYYYDHWHRDWYRYKVPHHWDWKPRPRGDGGRWWYDGDDGWYYSRRRHHDKREEVDQ